MTSPPATTQAYVGNELELFRHAVNWKRYLARQVEPFLRGRVLEVGAGLGGTTEILGHAHVDEWLCLEPDPSLTLALQQKIAAATLPRHCRARTGVLSDLEANQMFDAILYIDVLEHIEDDRAELDRAARHLAANGRVVVLSPAHQWLFSPFDRSVGHHRRYSRAMLKALTPPSLRMIRLRYLDSAGVIASGANRFLLKQSMPNERQLRFWDRVLVPLSAVGDRLTLYRLGKSILGVWSAVGSR